MITNATSTKYGYTVTVVMLRNFLSMLENCGKDAVAIAGCFVNQSEGFAVYSDYCTNYPKYVSRFYQYVHV